MTIDDLVVQYRKETKDTADPPFLADKDIVSFFEEAEDEACQRKDLLFDDSTDGVCVFDVDEYSAVYDLDDKIIRVTSARMTDNDGNFLNLKIVGRDHLDSTFPLWREENGDPCFLIVDDGSIQISPPPLIQYVMMMEVYRTPLVGLSKVLAAKTASIGPEIAKGHHRHLYHWVLHRAYAIRDNDMFDIGLSVHHEKKFSSYFGERPDADRLRQSRENRPHVNKLW